MVLGIIRRMLGFGGRGSGGPQSVSTGGLTRAGGPRGRFNGKCYEPAPGEIEEAEPIPPMFDWEDPREVLSEEELGWALLSARTWKPKARVGLEAYLLCDEVKLEGHRMPFGALAWSPEGKAFLIDYASFALLHLSSKGDKTAEEIVEEAVRRFVERAPPGNEVREAFLKDERSEEEEELLHGFIAAHYAQLTVLKKYGLIE